MSKEIQFYKMHGCGNDFIFVDNRALGVDVREMPEWARHLCRKGFGIHADGLVFLNDAPPGSGLAYTWNFLNKDGSMGEMCGNAARCAAMLAYKIGLARASHTFGTLAGPVRVEVVSTTNHTGRVRLRMPCPRELELNLELDLDEDQLMAHRVVVGVPHVVVFARDLEKMDVPETGRIIRNHHRFGPLGANVNFVKIIDRQTLEVRTYERGVEDETLACGTGAAASQFIASALGKTASRATVKTKGGFELDVAVIDREIYQQGPAHLVFKGQLYAPPHSFSFRAI